MADCLVVSASDWDHLMRAIGLLWLIAIASPFLAAFDLDRTEWRVRRFLRRRRIARIREAARA